MHKKLAKLTVGTIPAKVARKSQITPLEKIIQKWIERTITSEDQPYRTWFHKKRPVAIAPFRWDSRRNKPTSMMTSKMMSVMNEATTVVLALPMLRAVQ